MKDISPTGVYIFTRDHWPPGTLIELVLRRRSVVVNPVPPSVRLRARAVRLGLDGVGLMFDPEHIGADIWLRLVLKSADRTAQRDAVSVLRVSRALAFLRRFSPAAEDSVLDHIAGECVYESGEHAVETILKAEELVESWNFAIRTGVSPSLVLSILEHASRTNAEWVRQHWAGLLASAIRHWAKDRESAYFVDLLSRLEPAQVRILDAACSMALRAGREAAAGYPCPRELTFSKEAMWNLVGIADPVAIEQHLDRLYRFGLMEASVKRNLFGPMERANLTPTRLGMWLYARCKGLLEPPEPANELPERPVAHFHSAAEFSSAAPEDPDRAYAPASY